MGTYHHMTRSMAVDLVGNTDRTAPGACDADFPLRIWLEVPDGVVVFGVLEELIRCHGRHGAIAIGLQSKEWCHSGAGGAGFKG